MDSDGFTRDRPVRDSGGLRVGARLPPLDRTIATATVARGRESTVARSATRSAVLANAGRLVLSLCQLATVAVARLLSTTSYRTPLPFAKR